VTGGNADPLTPQGKAFAERLTAAGVDVTTMFWPDDYTPALQHEFQFDLRLEAAQETLAATRAFLARVMR
ncbi:alpha/beta hydrolase, partial [Aeromicrobium phragmitis]